MTGRIGLGLILLTAGLQAQAVEPLGTPYVYKTVDGRDLKLYVQSPESKAPAPAIVFFYGGGFVGGRPVQFNQQGKHLASRGMVAVQVDYRLLQRGGTEPPLICIQDAKSAMRWVRSHAKQLNIDPSRIASGGGSAGGHLATFVGVMDGLDDPQDDKSISAKSQAMVLFNPVFDNGPQGWGHALVGDRYREFSPYHNIHKGMPPALVMVGSADKLLPVATVKSFCEQANAVGARCEYKVYDGQPHGFFNYGKTPDNRYYLETLQATDDFLTSLGWLPKADAAHSVSTAR